MERSGNKARGRDQGGGGGEQEDPGRLGVTSSVPRSGEYGRSSEVAARRAPGARGSTPNRGGASWVNWQSALYVLVLGLVCVPLSSLTSFWWIVPVLGAIVLIALAALDRPRLAPGNPDDGKLKEQELLSTLAEGGDLTPAAAAIRTSLTSFWWIVPVLGAIVLIALAALDRSRLAPGNPDNGKLKEQELLSTLAEGGDLTPAAAAIRTSLTVDEASKMLEDLARKGHLQPQAGDGVVSYALPERDRQAAPDAASPPPTEHSEEGGESAKEPRQLEDPLSERELEVLRLLASGKTNSEAARDLFVSVGTVKSHTGNIYRKLGARNRAEALARARGLGLLR